ncbi:MAG: TolB family protein, partial [Anaerolineales bacterium]
MTLDQSGPEPPYGLWVSPLTPKSMSQGLRLSDVQWDTDGKQLVWLEGRSDRGVLATARVGQAPNDLTTDLSVRAMVGYGGGDFTVAHGHVVFSAGGRLYRQPLSAGPAQAITPGYGACASPTVSPDGKWVAYVHSYERREAVGLVDVGGEHWPTKILSGDDFYMQPAWHPGGELLSVVAWNHPQMPWDGAEVRLLQLDTTGRVPELTEVKTIAGGDEVACFQPIFSPDGRYLAYTSDATGWGQVYLYEIESGATRQLTHDPAEHAAPAWVQGVRTLAWDAFGTAIYAIRSESGFRRLWRYNIEGGGERVAAGGYSSFSAVSASPTEDDVAVIASAPGIPPRIVVVSHGGSSEPVVVKRAYAESVAPDQFSDAQAVSWTGDEGEEVYGLYYPPAGGQRAERSELPPAIIMIHGG